jgi:hypothetical protein
MRSAWRITKPLLFGQFRGIFNRPTVGLQPGPDEKEVLCDNECQNKATATYEDPPSSE